MGDGGRIVKREFRAVAGNITSDLRVKGLRRWLCSMPMGPRAAAYVGGFERPSPKRTVLQVAGKVCTRPGGQ